MVHETQTRQVPTTVTRMVHETHCKKVPYTVTKMVPHEVCKQVPTNVCTMQTCTVKKCVPYEVCKQVPYTTCVKVPYTTTEMVPHLREEEGAGLQGRDRLRQEGAEDRSAVRKLPVAVQAVEAVRLRLAVRVLQADDGLRMLLAVRQRLLRSLRQEGIAARSLEEVLLAIEVLR